MWAAAIGAVALLLAVSSRHGFHRDELYFVIAGRHPDWGYPDQPPLVPLLARAVDAVVGVGSPWGLRVVPALAVGAVALVAAAIARRYGGSGRAQSLSAVGVGWVGVLMGEGHLLSTAVFDFLAWSVLLLLVVMLLDGADPRWWVLAGAVAGVGFQNKHTIVALIAALLVGLLATPRRAMLWGRWPLAGAAVAAAIALPNLAWQAANGWPQIEMSRALADRSDGPLAFVLLQPLLLSIVMAVPAAVGWWWLWRSADRWRPIAIAYAVLFAAFVVAGGKAYYIAPMYAALIPAGMLWLANLRPRVRHVLGAAGIAGIAVGLFVALPLLPVSEQGRFDPTGEIGETVGWPELVDQVARVRAGLGDDTVVFTGSYGQAGAIDVLGSSAGLGPAWSGHNSYWSWGPPPPHGAVIGLGYVNRAMRLVCEDVERVGTIGNPYGVENEEYGLPILLCRTPQRQLAAVWDDVRHYD